ncbi:MAG: NAD(P)-dependent methylenetetrahydromethanopterin dehydrogenase [Pirellulaceae bacterium]
MSTPKILLQFDSDPLPSSFDAVVAIDCGIDHLLPYGNVTAENAIGLVHGAMFTRGPNKLNYTALFIGGSNVQTGEHIAKAVKQAFFGPIRVSVMLDGNGSNTTASAAVLCAARHSALPDIDALILGATGPVGYRAAMLIAASGGTVRLASRDCARAENVRDRLLQEVPEATSEKLHVLSSSDAEQTNHHLDQCTAVFGCGAAGVELLSDNQLRGSSSLKLAIDLNAVPPAGLAPIAVTDKAVDRDGRVDYGALGVGGLKMQIHKECVRRLFSANDLFLDSREIFAIGQELEASRAK